MSKSEDIKQGRIDTLLADSSLKFIQFKGSDLFSSPDTHGYAPLTQRAFSQLAYKTFTAGVSKGNIDDLLHALRAIAPDRSDLSRYVAFRDRIWDMERLEFTDTTMEWVYATDIAVQSDTKKAWDFLVQLAAGDEALAHDYLQAIAPLFMARKPSGVIWFVGDGANGKSSLISALYRLLGRYFASMTTAAIEDGRDTPNLNGKLGNIVRESSETRVEDTERYKAIGTHEPFIVHKFHSQDMTEVFTDFHTIFNANNIPVFSDKTKGARRRTLIIPFPAHFKDNPTFDDDTFTPEFLGGLATLVLETTKEIREQGYRFEWSDATLQAKASYDSDVNSAEAYMRHLEDAGVKGFYNYHLLKQEYENWCSLNGMVPLGITTLRRTLANEVNPIRTSVRDNEKTVWRYHFADVANDELVWLDNGYGMPQPKKKKQPTNGVLDKSW